MPDDIEDSEAWKKLEAVPLPMIVMMAIDSLEYEAVMDLEESASYRRRVIESGGDKNVVMGILEDVEASLDDVDQSRLMVSEDTVRLPIDPSLYDVDME